MTDFLISYARPHEALASRAAEARIKDHPCFRDRVARAEGRLAAEGTRRD